MEKRSAIFILLYSALYVDALIQDCPPGQFQCKSGVCVPAAQRCDGAKNCKDGSDELGCASLRLPKKETPHKGFRCGDGLLLTKEQVCDGRLDCKDSSDEADCSMKCRKGEFSCRDTCVPLQWRCDNYTDCRGGEDERNCKECSAYAFRCRNGLCVEGHLRCNGYEDCADWSDEEDCPAVVNNCTTSSVFTCGLDKKRINCSLVCDKKNDCGDWQDESEEFCGANECDVDNGGCDHTCVDTKEGFYCECREGYKLRGRYNCEDVDECALGGYCTGVCTNTVGAFKCSCTFGYDHDPNNYTRCIANEAPYLLFSLGSEIRIQNLRDNHERTVFNDILRANALDYLFDENQVFWSDISDRAIYRANFTDPKNTKRAFVENVTVEGLAVDWVHKNLYYTEKDTNTVHMISWDGEWRKAIALHEVGEPRAIVVSPNHGYVFWSDWGSHKIERAELDGSDRVVIEDKETVYWPNGLSVDHSDSRLYWCDGKLHKIMFSDFDGSLPTTILYGNDVLRHPYSISVFEDQVYWSDWGHNAIFSANKFTGSGVKGVAARSIAYKGQPTAIQVFHRARQTKEENMCLSGGVQCSHFCLRTPTGEAKCACPDELVLAPDGHRCIESHAAPDTLVIVAARTQIQNSMTPLLVGVTLGVPALIVLALLVFGLAWRKYGSREVPRIRFHNSVYRKTTANDDDVTGLALNQEQLMYNPKASTDTGYSINFSDSDVTPLSPKSN